MTSYFPFITVLVLVVFSALTTLVYRVRRNLTLAWLVATLGGLIAWVLTLLTGLGLPMHISLMRWSPVGLFPDSPGWMVDQVSWPFALALSTLALAVILTDVAREFEAESSSWAASLGLVALAITSIYSSNLVTFIMGWAALDFAELVFLLQHLREDIERRQAVAVFSARIGGIFLILYGQITAGSQGLHVEFESIPQVSILYLLLAVSLRLGIFPLHVPFWKEPSFRRGIGSVTRLLSPAASLVFLARIAAGGAPSTQSNLLFLFAGLAALYAGFAWYNAPDELTGRPFFILGMAALAFGSAIQGHPAGSLAWGVALVFAGGYLFLYSSRSRVLWILAMVVVASIAALPFTPSWHGGELYGAPFNFWQVLYLFAHVQILAGFIRHSRQADDDLSNADRWVRVFYPAGLLFLVISSFVAGWSGGGLVPSPSWGISLLSLLSGIVVLGLAVARVYWDPRIPRLPGKLRLNLRNVFSLGWFYTFLGWCYRLIGSAVSFVTLILEGEGGMLWALLLFTLLIAFLTGSGVIGS